MREATYRASRVCRVLGSPLAEDLLLVYSPLLPVPFRRRLLERGFDLVEVPEDEFESMACNVLSRGDRKLIAIEETRRTTARLREHGFEVGTFHGSEISHNGGGGPTCLTRPILRA